MRENFELDYNIGNIDIVDIKSLMDNPIRRNYLFISLQMVNNILRDIFISYLSKNGDISPKKRKILLDLLENKLVEQDKENYKSLKQTIIRYISTKQDTTNNPLENIDCISEGFILMLKIINEDDKQCEKFKYHLLHERVLPINCLSDLISLLERTLEVKDYIRHLKTKKLPIKPYFVATMNLICILTLPAISKIYIDRFNLTGFFEIWEYWNNKHKANLDIYFGLERAKKQHKKQINSELKGEELKTEYSKINEKSKKIARDDDSWQKLYKIYTNEHSGFKYWNFKKVFNYIGNVFIEKRFGIENSYDYETTKPSFRYEIYSTYILYTKVQFIFFDMYYELLGNFKTLEFKVFDNISAEETEKLKQKGWQKSKKGKKRFNPFKNFDNLINDISHNRDYNIDKNTFENIMNCCVYLDRKDLARKFIQDFLVMCKKENYKVELKDGAKLTYCGIKSQYYYFRFNKEQTEQSNNDKYNKLYIDKANIMPRNFIRDIVAKWKKDLKCVIKKSGFKEPTFKRTRNSNKT